MTESTPTAFARVKNFHVISILDLTYTKSLERISLETASR